ncbi:MAG: zinc transporter ZntB, partial [Alphaproteobacteria bacterium]|nr:zinc transporter ZntB [Alphaproteobacteria bacterium]
ALRSRQQSQRAMYILTLVTALFLPLTFITGLLGMNVGGIPGDESAFGFAGAVGVMVAVLGVELWLFRRIGLIS